MQLSAAVLSAEQCGLSAVQALRRALEHNAPTAVWDGWSPEAAGCAHAQLHLLQLSLGNCAGFVPFCARLALSNLPIYLASRLSPSLWYLVRVCVKMLFTTDSLFPPIGFDSTFFSPIVPSGVLLVQAAPPAPPWSPCAPGAARGRGSFTSLKLTLTMTVMCCHEHSAERWCSPAANGRTVGQWSHTTHWMY